MRVPQVVTSDQRRGAGVFAVDLAAALRERAYDAPVCALAPSGDAAALPVPALGPSALAPATLRALRSAARGADAVVAHGSRTLPACAVALAGSRIPFVYRSIGDPRAWSSTGLRRVRTTLLLRRARLVTVLWPGAADALAEQHGVRQERVRVVPNGVPAQRFPRVDAARRAAARERLGIPADAPVVACIGSLTPEKDVAAAVTALSGLPDVQLLVAGDGPDRTALEQQAAAACPGRVRFLGSVDDVTAVLATSDAVVLPSRTEGMPGVLVEAGLSGLPVVATDVGAVPEVVVDGRTGVLVPPGDPAALREAVATVLAGPAGMGAAARQHCLARFEIGVVAATWAGVLDEIAGGR